MFNRGRGELVLDIGPEDGCLEGDGRDGDCLDVGDAREVGEDALKSPELEPPKLKLSISVTLRSSKPSPGEEEGRLLL